MSLLQAPGELSETTSDTDNLLSHLGGAEDIKAAGQMACSQYRGYAGLALTRMSGELSDKGHMGQSQHSCFDVLLLPGSPCGVVWRQWVVLTQRGKTEFS